MPIWIGSADLDRLFSYPQRHNLSSSWFPIHFVAAHAHTRPHVGPMICTWALSSARGQRRPRAGNGVYVCVKGLTGSSHCGVWGWSKRPGGRGQCRGTTTEHRSSPWAPHQPKLACNSGTRTFCSARKRCNSNGAISTFEIRVGELHATFLRNHNMRRHKGTTKCPKQKTTQAQKTPTTPTAATTATSTGALHPIWG